MRVKDSMDYSSKRSKILSTSFPSAMPEKLSRMLKIAKEALAIFWLTTMDDFDTFVLPNCTFGLSVAFSDPAFNLFETSSSAHALLRVLLAISFNWSNLWIFDLANQSLPEYVEEDKVNKPWRPIPTNRMSLRQARHSLLASIPLVWLGNAALGTGKETIALIGLTWMYNDLGGGNDSWIVRNSIVACAFAFYNTGSLRIAAGGRELHLTEYCWVGLISCVILTTMQVQDMKDQEGDRKHNRQTAPLVLGDETARWTICGPVMLWSVACCCFWETSLLMALPSVVLGLWVAFRILRYRGKAADRATWKWWCLWTAVLYLLPTLKRLERSCYPDVLS